MLNYQRVPSFQGSSNWQWWKRRMRTSDSPSSRRSVLNFVARKPSWMEQDKSIDDIFEYGKTYEILWVYAVWDLYSMIAIPKRCWGITTHFSKLLELAQKTNWPFTLSAVVVKRTSLGQSATLLPQRIPEENQFEPQCIRPHERTAESAQSASAVPCGQISNPFLFDAKSSHG